MVTKEAKVAKAKNLDDRYFPGQYIGLDNLLEKRCVAIHLLGPGVVVGIKPMKILNPSHIEFCFGAKNVRVHFAIIESATLKHWLNRGKTFPQDITGFSGPAGTTLFIVFKKDSVL